MELYHHGIKGQKWGKRNGPPYPLGASDHSASERKAGWRMSLSGNSNNSVDKKHNSGKNYNKSSKGSIDKETGFRKISNKEGDSERLAKCNPKFQQTNYVTPYNRNCGNTVIADELRKRGLDVEARGNNWGLTVTNMNQFFNGIDDKAKKEFKIKVPGMKYSTKRALFFGKGDKEKVNKDLRERGKIVKSEFSKEIASSYPDGSRGCMMITGMCGSHWISWSINNGKVEFTNPQNPKEDLLLDFGTHTDFSRQGIIPTTIRLDNLRINKNNIKNVVMNSSDKKTDAKGMSFDPLITSGIKGVNSNPYLRTNIERYYGPRWDGSWEAFDSIANKTIKELKSG